MPKNIVWSMKSCPQKKIMEEEHFLESFFKCFLFGAFRFSKACFNALILIHNIVNAILKRCHSKLAPNF